MLPGGRRVVFGEPTDDNQSRIHALEATTTSPCRRQEEIRGERGERKRREGTRASREKTRRARKEDRPRDPRVIWSTPVPRDRAPRSHVVRLSPPSRRLNSRPGRWGFPEVCKENVYFRNTFYKKNLSEGIFCKERCKIVRSFKFWRKQKLWAI